MNKQRRLITREIRAAQNEFRALSLTDPHAIAYDPAGNNSPVFVIDLHVGSNAIVRKVPVRPVNGSRTYARVGQAVVIRRGGQGRFVVVGPADRVPLNTVVKELDLDTGVVTSQPDAGFKAVVVAFEFYEGPTPPTPGTSRWNNGSDEFPKIQIQDAQGNPA